LLHYPWCSAVTQLRSYAGAWTTVPLSQFHFWQACFVREDGPFMFFGLAAGTVFIALLYLRHEVARASR
jgi:hypothetical protein